MYKAWSRVYVCLYACYGCVVHAGARKRSTSAGYTRRSLRGYWVGAAGRPAGLPPPPQFRPHSRSLSLPTLRLRCTQATCLLRSFSFCREREKPLPPWSLPFPPPFSSTSTIGSIDDSHHHHRRGRSSPRPYGSKTYASLSLSLLFFAWLPLFVHALRAWPLSYVQRGKLVPRVVYTNRRGYARGARTYADLVSPPPPWMLGATRSYVSIRLCKENWPRPRWLVCWYYIAYVCM